MGVIGIGDELDLEPFDPKKHKPKDVGHGAPSTELLRTEYSPDGSIWNIPSLWFDKSGSAIELGPEQSVRAAEEYEVKSGKKFPRFNSIDEGVTHAKKRSEGGGASTEPLASEVNKSTLSSGKEKIARRKTLLDF